MTDDEIIRLALEAGFEQQEICLSGTGESDRRLTVGEYPIFDAVMALVKPIAERAEVAEKDRDEAGAENERLRAALAMSDRPCIYCSLPVDEWAKCTSGFPGCARGDDATGCPHLGASLEADAMRELIDLHNARCSMLQEDWDRGCAAPQPDHYIIDLPAEPAKAQGGGE